jgi:hypothetical protein
VTQPSTTTPPATVDESIDDVSVVDDPAIEADRDRGAWWPAAGFTALVVVAIGVALVSATRQPWLPTSDDALMALRGQDALHHPPLTGPYSRFGFDHPGPIVFYLLYPFIKVLGPSGALLAAAGVSAASVVAAGWLAWRRGGFWLSLLLSSGLLLFVRAMGSTVIDPWNPWIALLPFFVCVVAAWSVWCDDWWALPVLVVAGTFASQTHISYAPFVWLLFAAAVAWLVVSRVRRRDRLARSGVALAVSGAALLVLWLPPIIDQVHSDQPNGTAIVRHFTGGDPVQTDGFFTGTDKPGMGQVAGTYAIEMGVPAPWLGVGEQGNPFTGEIETGSLLRLLPTLLVFAAAFVVGWRRRARDAIKLQALVAALSLVGVVVLSRVTGGVFDYVVRWLWVFGALAWLSALWTLLWCVLDGRVEPHPRARLVAAVVPLALFVWTVASLRDATPPNPPGSDALEAVIEPVTAALSPSGPVLVNFDSLASVDIRSGLLTELDRRGFDVVVADKEAHRYGDWRAVGDRAIGSRLEVRVGADFYNRSAPDDGRLLARFDPLNPADRAWYDQLRPRFAAEYQQRLAGQPVTDPLSDEDRARFQALDAIGPPAAVYLVTS